MTPVADRRANKGSNGGPTKSVSVSTGAFVAIAVFIAAIVGSLLYARGSAAAVGYALIIDGATVLFWIAGAAGLGAWPTAWLLRIGRGTDAASNRRGHGLTLGIVTAIALGLGVLSLAVLGLGLLGVLGRLTSIGLLAAGWAAGAAWIVSIGQHLHRAQVEPVDRNRQIAWLWLITVPLLAASLTAAFLPPGLLWKPEEPHGYDVVEYHLQVPREWYEAGRIQPLEHNAFSYFPFGVEMHYLLAMHIRGGPWAGMYAAQLMHMAMVVLSVIAAAALAKQFCRNQFVATIAPLFAAVTPWFSQLAPLAFNEGGLLLYGTLAVGWTMLAIRRWNATTSGPTPARFCLRQFCLAGLLAGFACGVKLTAVPLLLVAVPMCVLVVAMRRAPRAALAAVIVYGLTGAAVFAPWLIRTAAWTGNPVFPEGTAVFGNSHFSDVQVDRWKQAHAARPDQRPVAARLHAFADQVLGNWQFGYVALPIGVVAMALGWRQREAWFLAILLAIHLVFWLGFTHLQGRFFVLAIPIATLAIAVAPWERLGKGRIFAFCLLIVAVVTSALLATINLHQRLTFKLYRDQGTGLAMALANEDLSWITFDSVDGFPRTDPAARLILVGDAQAFWYPVPMTQLRYRTVFDLDPRRGSLLDSFDPAGERRSQSCWLLVSPGEVERYQKTYQPMSPVPEALLRLDRWQNGLPFRVPSSAVAGQ